HVAEMRRRNVLARHRLEIEHVDRVLGRGDQVFGAHRRPADWVFRRERGESRPGEQRTARHELQKAAAAFSFDIRARHCSSPVPQSTRAPEAFTTGAHFAISAFTNAENCSGVFGTNFAPSFGSRAWISGDCMTRITSPFQ